jgi:hypothetical protein
MKRLLLLLFFLCFTVFTYKSFAQYYISGQDPASIKWNQINSENFQVIYPVGYDSIAQYVMNVMEYGRELTMQSHHTDTKKISVILHNQTIISNAEVAWAPRRMEFYTVGPQDSYSQEWFQQLALHEYVHVLQISSMHAGLTKFLYHLFGEQITVGIFGLYVPYWFIEGDAVVSETALSKAGRGRDPNFEMELRAQLLEIGPYSLEKANLGSFEDFTTDRYHLGYYMVGQGRAAFGRNMWNLPMEKVGKYPLMVVPFSHGIKYETQMTKKPFYEWSLKELTKEWSVQLAKTQPDNYTNISNQKSFVNYTHNAWLNKEEIFSIENDYHGIGRFVKFDTKGIKSRVFTPGYYMNDRISVGGDYITWVEIKYDPRWSNRKNTKLFVYNYQTGEKRKLVNKERYFSPQLSSTGDQIAVIEVNEFNKNYLVVLSSEDGSILERIEAPENLALKHPYWNEQGNKLVVEALGLEGKTLLVIDRNEKEFIQMLPWQTAHILNPRFWENYILFEASYNGVMNIYALDMNSKSIFQTTNVAFGAGDFNISPDGNEIVFSNYTSKGKVLATQKWKPEDWIPFSEVIDHRYPLADILSDQEDTILRSDLIPNKKYEEKKYSKIGHLINLHSWNFLHLDANNGSINPGVSILSQNKLGTMTARLGVDYSYNTNALRYYGQVDYLGWYPAISLGADYGRRWTYEIDNSDTTYYYWYETNMNALMYVPLLYTSGTWAHNIQPQIGFQYKQIDGGEGLDFDYKNVKTAVYGVQYSAQSKSPYQNIFPRWGFALSLAYRQSIEMPEKGNMLVAGASLYVPGMFRHDGLRLMASYQDKEGDADFFTDWTAPARGYSGISYTDLITLRADYSVPLAYPDANLSSLIYLKRIKLNFFYDYSILPDLPQDSNHPVDDYFWSYGGDISFDLHFLRSKFPFELGLRTSIVNGYANNPNGAVFQLLWGVGI